jgi:predicted transcriptional regulator
MDNCDETSALLNEVVAIKKLLVLCLLRDGLSQSDVGAAIGVDQSTVSRMFPKGLPKKRR